jgi:uncharacterized protein
MTEPVETPEFRVLTPAECHALLARHSVGRVAFVRANRVEIIPLHYVFANGVLSGRTAPGTRLGDASANFYNAWPVAFEIDEFEELFRWRSVVVHGNLHGAAPGDAEWLRNTPAWEDAMRSFRTLMPEAFTERDPAGFRDILIRIDAAEVSGREALPGRGTS